MVMPAPLEVVRDFVNSEASGESLAVREAIRALLRANNGVDVPVTEPTRVLDQAAHRVRLQIGFMDGGLQFVAGERSRVARVLEAVAVAMADDSWPRLKACRADDCQWAFVDHARNRSRHWCDMAICGNRAKAQRFRERHA